jgi:hypothetical protein
MLSRSAKAAYYAFASPLMRVNSFAHRRLWRASRAPVKAHLGPGQRNYLPGWINVDANAFTAKCDIWADLRYRLPFPDECLRAAYSHHVVEHLPDLRRHFRDVFRCLLPGAAYRVGGPHGHNAMRKYLEGDAAWFSSFPDHRESIGGRLENFLLCRNEHLAILTPSYLREVAADAGFDYVGECEAGRTTQFPELFGADVLGAESESDREHPHTLIVELRRPAASHARPGA